MKACTASLNFETDFSISSAEDESITSQPVSSVSAPRLAPPAMKRRRLTSGIVLMESLISSRLSTPGIRNGRLAMVSCSALTADDHRAQTLRHQQREQNVNDEEGADRGHAEEMDVA